MNGAFLKLDPLDFATEPNPYGEEIDMFRSTVRTFFKRESESRVGKLGPNEVGGPMWSKASGYDCRYKR